MTDREKVIKGLETCIKYIYQDCPIGCPYYEVCTKHEGRVVFQPVLRDAFELLKEQEPVEPKLVVDALVCGNCGHDLIHQEILGDNVLFEERYNYCPQCGKKVKWE